MGSLQKSAAPRSRPLSPHLSVYRMIPTMAMSILHRITGTALYFGIVLLIWWIAAAAGSPEYFALARSVLGSWFGLLVLFGFTWALFHHMLGGIRHLIWDTGRLMDRQSSTRLAWATLAGSVLLTVLAWAVGLA
jgi:succinate dehydrogenase / fumarate reductase cytochrome b subunit